MLALVRSGEATSRAEIARRTSLARSTVGQQVNHLLTSGLVTEDEGGDTVRGRPPRVLRISPQAGVIAAADVDGTATHLAISDLTGKVLAREVTTIPVEAGPERALGDLTARIRALLDGHASDRPLRHVVVGLPAPITPDGCTVKAPITLRAATMSGWDGTPVATHLEQALSAPVTVDNDVNLMALGEAAHDAPGPLLFIKAGAGIGSGVVTAEGTVLRGADGAAGDINHLRIAHDSDVVCACGHTGCLGSVASYRAVLNDLDIPFPEDPLHGSRQLAELVASGDPTTLRRIRRAATHLGEAAALLIQFQNPRTLVLGGLLAQLNDDVLSGVRAAVYDRAAPLFTRKLTITTSTLGDQAGVLGGITLALDRTFDNDGLTRLLNDR
ncbi:ROK family protein [Saccharopolyspora karakumensis]|uniref:ROK family protein n=2 Tax=Saccharopolyspora karakumensis TaxID=2530386 RepID=A0A4R5BXY3_9PSEU|nr:ROK family protein [Saccharopolyspora karakumensis]